MKQNDDQKTIDMIGMPKKRGRPSTGSAQSAAERKRAQRKRDTAKFLAFEGLDTLTESGLIEMLHKGKIGDYAIKEVWEEIGKRRGYFSDNHN